MKQCDEDWLAGNLRRCDEIKVRLCQEPNAGSILWHKMPRNPSLHRYEQHSELSDKAAFLKSLINLHEGEVRDVRELTTDWVKVHAPLPKYHSQYAPEFFVQRKS